MRGDPESGRAETASAATSAQPAPVEPVAVVLGRYRLLGELGHGAIGVVHAAFDPDLERRVALKVLRSPTAASGAKARLLREARAMARLAHPNVVTVYEVGTASGRDFVAMELIHGETLAQWFRSARRSPAAVINAFLAAGRGLAAAHAAGIVHRDFKPSNVLCSRDRRIVVTDFGLARETEGELPAGLETTLPARTPTPEPGSSGSLPELTVTGALLGTPPYMAPEQWNGGAITSATDQFAFCVALWEALAGERPYRGATRDEIRRQVMQGPATLDASRIPRGLRNLLRRGLDPVPARRWPTMDALLVQLARAQRRPKATFTILAAGSAVGIVAVLALLIATRDVSAPVAACEPPARDLATVWSQAIADAVRARVSAAHAMVFADAHSDWQAARRKACAASPTIRPQQLQCLDGVLERFDALHLAEVRVPEAATDALQAQLVDPEVCRTRTIDVPRLTLRATPGVIAAYVLLGRSESQRKPSDSEITTLIDSSTLDPCARVIATLAFNVASQDIPRARSLMRDAAVAADQCGDERLRADLLIQDVPNHWESPIVGPKGEIALEQAEHAAAHVMQPELAAPLALLHAIVAHQRGEWDVALRRIDEELAAYGARGLHNRQLQAVLMRNYLRLGRADPRDLEAISSDVQSWRTVAVANHETELARQLDTLAAQSKFRLGDVEATHLELLRLWHAQPSDEQPTAARKITGEVVDLHGQPIAGATVAASSGLLADSASIGRPDLVPLEDFRDLDLRTTISDATGHFVVNDAAPAGVIVAQLIDRRSLPRAFSDHVKLVLAPTRTISGTIDLGHTPHTHVSVYGSPVGDPTGRYTLIAPVAQDGSFTLRGAPIGAVRLGLSIRGVREYDERIEYQWLSASTANITGVRFSVDGASSDRALDVIVRSTVSSAIEGAEVVLLAGKHAIKNAGELLQLQPMYWQYSPATPVAKRDALDALLGRTHPGDLVAHFDHVASGDLTVCAGPYGDLGDPRARRLRAAHIAQVNITCKHLDPDTNIVEVAVPLLSRFE